MRSPNITPGVRMTGSLDMLVIHIMGRLGSRRVGYAAVFLDASGEGGMEEVVRRGKGDEGGSHFMIRGHDDELS